MAKTIINLTQHIATAEQREAGVFDLSVEHRQELAKLLTIDTLPDYRELRRRAAAIGDIIEVAVNEIGEKEGFVPRLMVGGAPFLMPVLCRLMEERFSTECLYAFSKRVSIEDPVTGVKTSVFKHEGFVPHFSD